MCNLYRMNTSRAEIADLFGAVAGDISGNAPAEIYPGYPGVVVAKGAVRQMVWGFPLARTGATRTWFSLPDERPMAVAGLWRDTAEWGPAYTMVMTSACVHVADVHDRMPVILPRSDWRDWLDGAPDAAHLLCRPYPGDILVARTREPWAGAR